MIIILSGATHTGKTVLAQKLLERYKYSVLSQDLLKMGLIRSKNTSLTPEDDREMTLYLWEIVREIIKTAVENKQNLIVEGCYVPFDWEKDFLPAYLENIRTYFLIFTEKYIRNHYKDIMAHANDIEARLNDSGCTIEYLIAENSYYLEGCKRQGCRCIAADERYNFEEEIINDLSTL